ncbi:MAG TPA: aminotransferase class IV [Tepidisphaeraceae bacterium]|nr:aminotransferase class IV [Tepidisphaeraceae bacterium]
MSSVWINGNFIDESQASISIRDAGLLHAAGVFTTMRSYSGKVFRLDQHLKRLRDSCEALFIPLTYKDDALTSAVAEILSRNHISDGRLRLSVTRGQAINDPIHGLRLEPNIFLTAAELEPYPADFYQRGMTVILLDEQKLNPYDIQAGHKTLNYFSRLAALREANRRGAGEALWFNVHNYLQSGSISNVFVVKAGKLLTPPTPQEMLEPAVRDATPYPKSAVLPGITRAAIIELAREAKIEINPTAIDVNLLLDADEIFLSNSIMQIMPVCRIERRAIGNDQPGPITLDLSQRLTKLIAASA